MLYKMFINKLSINDKMALRKLHKKKWNQKTRPCPQLQTTNPNHHFLVTWTSKIFEKCWFIFWGEISDLLNFLKWILK